MKRANCSFCGGKVVEENIDTECTRGCVREMWGTIF